ncbi:MAG: hypothetical protein QXU69_08940 [Thermofilaceae archaeon]
MRCTSPLMMGKEVVKRWLEHYHANMSGKWIAVPSCKHFSPKSSLVPVWYDVDDLELADVAMKEWRCENCKWCK